MIDFALAHGKLSQFEYGAEIADFLKEQGIKGLVGGITSCPLAVWMRGQTGLNVRVNYSAMKILGFNNEITDYVFNTSAIKEFIKYFDDGDYPYLVTVGLNSPVGAALGDLG